MKNNFFNWNKIVRNKVLLFSFFLTTQINFAQCTITGFTVTKTNTICSANGAVKVTIPNSTNCAGWVAELTKQGGSATTINIPVTGGDVNFTSLGVGNYNLRLTDGTTSINYSGNPINITTTYVNMTYSFSTVAPTCPNTLDGTLTATVGAGTGTGPFVYKLISPTLGTIISTPQTSRSYTFTGLKGGENVDLSITDKVNGETGCEITVNRYSYSTAVQTNAGLAFNGTVRALNFYKNCSTSPCSVDMVVNLANVTPSRKAKLDEAAMNAKVTIAGVDYALTLVNYNASLQIAQYKYDPVTTGGPPLYHGTNIQVSFVDICGILSLSKAVYMPNNEISNLYYLASSDVTTCAPIYTLRIENFPDDGTLRSILFCPQNTLRIKIRTAVNPDYYSDIPSTDISPDPNRSNPLSVTQTNGNSIAGGRAEYYLTKPGTYQIIAKDDCQEVTRYITINPTTPVFENATVTEVASVLQGTSALSVNFGSVSYKSPIHIKIRRADGKTLVGYNATAPFQLGGQKYISFPIDRDYVFTDNIARSFTVSDLPLGSYIVELTNSGCPTTTTITRNITLTKPAEYAMLDGDITTNDSPVKVNLGCLGSSQIVFNMGKNANVSIAGSTELWTATPQGAPLAYVATGGAISGGGSSLQATFSNLNPGNYLVRVLNISNGFSPAEQSVNNPATGPWQYSIPATIPAFTPIKVETATVFCDQTNPNSGIVNVEITEGTVTYPLSFALYNVNNPNTPIETLTDPLFETYNVRSVSFQNVPQGNYFVRISTPCYSVDTNVTVSLGATVPNARTSSSTICKGSPATLSVFTTQNLYTVSWTLKNNSNVIGTGSSIVVYPTTTTTYTAHYQLLSVYGCSNTVYESDVTITVLPLNLSVDVTPSQIELCDYTGTTIPIIVKNSSTGFNYEVVDANGSSFTPIVTKPGLDGTDLVFNVPISGLIPGSHLKIRPTSSNSQASCTATLEKEVAIVSSSKRNDLSVTGSTVCPGINGTITISSTENGVQYEVLRSGASLSPPVTVIGNGANGVLIVPASQLLSTSNTFTIRATAVGCTPVILTNSATISVLSAPIANAGVDFNKTCVTNPNGNQIGMTAEAGNMYSWTANTTSASLTSTTIANPIANPITTTEYTLTVTDTNGCTATDKVMATVNLGAPAFNVGADFTKNCISNINGKTIGLSSSTSGYIYLWSSSTNANLSTSYSYLANPSVTTNYTLTITYPNGCTASDDVLVTVNTTQPNNPIILSIDHPTCLNSTGTVTIASTGNTGDTYSIDNGVTFQGSNVFNNVAAGTHLVKIKSAASVCISNSISAIVNAQPITPSTPTISAGSSTTFCIGGSVVLTSSAAVGNQWYKDGVLISGASAPTYTADQSGTYTVIVTNSYRCSSPVSAGVIVVVNDLPVATINNGITLAFVNCSATTIDLTASNGSGFEWYYSTDNVTAFSVLPATTQTITASNLGFYKVKVINSTNCEAISQVTHVVATPAVSATELETCVGNTVTLRSNTSSFDTPTYKWKKDGNYIDGATTQNWDVTVDGEYSVEVTDGRTVGSIGTQTSCGANVKFNPLPVVNAGTDFTITCATNASGLTIGETPETGFSYAWTSPNGVSGLSNAAIANPMAHPTATTTYTVRKTNQTTLCWTEDSITITVDTTLPLANAGVDFTKTCIDNTLGKEIGVSPISGVTYSWFPTTGLDDATKANPIANPATTTLYTVTATNTVNRCYATDTVVATVDVSAPTANAGTDFTKTCATNPIGKLIGVAAVSGETYLWSPATGLDNATSANPNANPSATTIYTLTATKTATGCTAIDSVTVTVLDTPNPVALSSTIANNCPLETVDLSTIQPAAISGIVYEWWTGTATSRGTQITNPTTYAVAGTIYLWSKTSSEGCYNATPFEVNVVMNVCCMPTVGQLVNSDYLIHFEPADITSLNHINYPIPSVVRYVIVNDLDGKIKQVNTTKPEFTQLPAGNYTVHALVFGPTVVPTGLVVGNKLSQVQPSCGTSATIAVSVQSICSSKKSFTQTLPNVKQYALLDVSTNQLVQVNTTGTFTMIHTGMPHQVVGFNYTGTASGIQVGGTLAGLTATNLDITAGSIVTGCTAVITQIDGNIYNDKDKKCMEGFNSQVGLPTVTLYAKLLNSSNQVIAVSSAIQTPGFTFSMSPDLLDDTYSIILDDNNAVSDAVATYPNSWKGNSQTFTIASGQIVEHLSNTANFVPMCMQSATNKPILKPTANLVGNTYNFCQGATASSINVDALPGATVNWYTQAVGGVAKTTPLLPNTSVVGTTSCYVSQTVNGAESDRTEVIIAVHALPEQPTAIAGNNFIAANTTQSYSVINSSSAVTYNWILPTDWTGISTTKDITVQVGTKDGKIGVTATSVYGCVSPIQQLVVRVVIEDDIEVYNSLSPNGDGDNDIFRIRNIDFYPENTLSIFNRWGIEVYRVTSYGQNDNFFKGFSDGRSTVNRDVELPEGTYFYTLTYKNTKGIERNLSGYLYIKQ